MLENSEADAELIKHELSRAGLEPVTKRVDSEEAFASALREFAPELVLSDHSLAQFDARAAVRVLRKLRPATPLIVVSGSLNGEKTVEYELDSDELKKLVVARPVWSFGNLPAQLDSGHAAEAASPARRRKQANRGGHPDRPGLFSLSGLWHRGVGARLRTGR